MTLTPTGPEPGSPVPIVTRSPGWLVPVVIAAAVLGLAGLGTGIYAIATKPAKTSGPIGAQGATGAQGAAGAIGQTGPAGPAGPAGNISTTSIVAATTVVSPAAAPAGTVLTAKTSCPTGTVLVGGGAQVADTGPAQTSALRSSFPVNATTWEVTAVALVALPAGATMTLKPYVVCGVVPPTTTSTTAPTAPTAPTATTSQP